VSYPARCHKFPQRKEGLLLGAPGGREGRRQRKRGVSISAPKMKAAAAGGLWGVKAATVAKVTWAVPLVFLTAFFATRAVQEQHHGERLPQRPRVRDPT